jgi:hypothetical protein
MPYKKKKSYHNTLAEHSPPTSLCSKKRILEWLEKNKTGLCI